MEMFLLVQAKDLFDLIPSLNYQEGQDQCPTPFSVEMRFDGKLAVTSYFHKGFCVEKTLDLGSDMRLEKEIFLSVDYLDLEQMKNIFPPEANLQIQGDDEEASLVFEFSSQEEGSSKYQFVGASLPLDSASTLAVEFAGGMKVPARQWRSVNRAAFVASEQSNSSVLFSFKQGWVELLSYSETMLYRGRISYGRNLNEYNGFRWVLPTIVLLMMQQDGIDEKYPVEMDWTSMMDVRIKHKNSIWEFSEECTLPYKFPEEQIASAFCFGIGRGIFYTTAKQLYSAIAARPVFFAEGDFADLDRWISEISFNQDATFTVDGEDFSECVGPELKGDTSFLIDGLKLKYILSLHAFKKDNKEANPEVEIFVHEDLPILDLPGSTTSATPLYFQIEESGYLMLPIIKDMVDDTTVAMRREFHYYGAIVNLLDSRIENPGSCVPLHFLGLEAILSHAEEICSFVDSCIYIPDESIEPLVDLVDDINEKMLEISCSIHESINQQHRNDELLMIAQLLMLIEQTSVELTKLYCEGHNSPLYYQCEIELRGGKDSSCVHFNHLCHKYLKGS